MFSIFKKTPQELPFNSFAEYYIGPGIKVKGEFKTDQDIYIDGAFTGNITTTGLVELAKNSSVNASIFARTAIFEGEYSGKCIISDELHITSCATLVGDVKTQNILVDKGAIIKAGIQMERG